MLTGAMLARAEEHLARMLALAPAPGVGAVVVANVAPDGDGAIRPVPLTAGVLDAACISRLVRDAVPEGVPLVLLDADVGGQRALLAG
jgi:hypothetical protein